MRCSGRAPVGTLPVRDHHRAGRDLGTVSPIDDPKELSYVEIRCITRPPPSDQPRLNSVAFTVTIDKQDGRRFSGTFSSPRGNDKFVAVISRNTTILLVDDDGYTVGTILAPNRMEWCYMHLSQATRVASCTELTKQP